MFALQQADREGAGPVYTTPVWQNWNPVSDTKVPLYHWATVKRHGRKRVYLLIDWS